MKKIFYKFLWSFFAFLLLIFIIKNKNFSTPPIEGMLHKKNLAIKATGVKINLQSNDSHIKMYANNIHIQDTLDSKHRAITFKDNVSYSENNEKFISAEYAKLLLEKKEPLDYSVKKESLLSVFFKNNVRIKSATELIATDEAKYLLKEKMIYGNRGLTVDSKTGYAFKSEKGFKWDLKNEVIILDGKTKGTLKTF